jgi:hypothetical protein
VKGALGTMCVAAVLAGCGDDAGMPSADEERGAGVGALGGGAQVETLARTRLRSPPSGRVAWVADEFRLEPGDRLQHTHELAFVYGRRGTHTVDEAEVGEGEGAAVRPDSLHSHVAGDEGAAFWEIRLAPPRSRPAQGARRVFESEQLEGIPAPAAASFLAVTVSPRGGRTTVHTHPGPEFIYQLSGRIDYQNAIVGTKRLGPGGAEAIPPDTAVQKRNPYSEPALFLSWFLVDPERPFAPSAEF